MTDGGSGSRKQRATAQRGTKIPKQSLERPRRVSRRDKEAKRQKQIRIGIAVTAALVITLLLGFGIYDYVVKPRQVLATVDGSRIRREDYWRFRSLDLYNQVVQYQQYATSTSDASQQQQYLALAQQAQASLGEVWGSTDVDDATLNRMVQGQIYLSSLDEFGLTVTDADVELYALNQFSPADAPLIEPTAFPTLVPERAAWATGTAEALLVTPGAEVGTTGSTPVIEAPVGGSPVGISGSPAASPIAIESDSSLASPEASPAISPTPDAEQAQQTAEAGFKTYGDTVFSDVHMSRSDYLRIWVKPQVALQKVRDVLIANVGQTADQVHAEHILVATEELANQIYADVTTGGQNFETVAREKSTDTSTAPNGGDLGWFPRGVMVAPFEEAAFNTEPGQIHPPVQSEFGWHIIKVLDSQTNRAMSDQQISQLQDSTVNKWLEQRQAEIDISSVMAPTPTPVAETFIPPADAPAPPLTTPTETVPAAPESSPVAEVPSPVAQAEETTVAAPASPIANDVPAVATPAAAEVTPVITITPATPETGEVILDASPIASPSGSPVGTPIVNPLGTPENR